MNEPSSSSSGSQPRTTYEAARRYLSIYESSYVVSENASAIDMRRLRNKCEAYIHYIRKAAPKFYTERLPDLIDQAGTLLLTFDISTPEGQTKVFETHAYFMLILKDLSISQPAGPLDFFFEKKRFEEKCKLEKQLEGLKAKISELEASEFDPTELGEEDDEENADNRYNRVFSELQLLRAESKRVALEIAYLYGEDLEEEEVNFELRFGPNSMLHKLSKEQLDILESQLDALYKTQHKKGCTLVVDKSLIDNMFEMLNLDQTKYRKCDIHDMQVDALEAYKSFRRQLEQERSNEYFQILLENERLLPKEGIVLSGPDDIPPDIRARLDQNDRSTSRVMTKLFEDFGNKTDIDENSGGNNISESDSDDGTSQIVKSIKEKGAQYARVKEEPLDDDEDLEEELLFGDTGDNVAQDGPDQPNSDSTKGPDNREVVTTSNQTSAGGSNVESSKNVDDDSDDSIICLGTIEPKSKVIIIDID